MSIEFIVILITALVFDFLNGFHDSSNIVATPIASRALSPSRRAVVGGNRSFIGLFSLAQPLPKQLVKLSIPNAITLNVVLAAMLSAVLWNLITWYLGIPSSSSHALIGGLIGAVIVSVGVEALKPQSLIVVTVALFASPVLGLFAGYLLMKATLFLARGASPRINWFSSGFRFFLHLAWR